MRAGSFVVTLGISSFAMGCPLLEKNPQTDSVGPTPDVAVVKPAPAPVIPEVAPVQTPAIIAVATPKTPVPAEPMVAPSVAEIPELPPDPAAPVDAPQSEPEKEVIEEAPAEPEKAGPEKDAAPKPAKDVFELASIAKETWIYAEPRWKSQRIGYLRAGATVVRKEKPRTRAHCAEGWFAIEPRGYVCVGTYATLDVHHPIAEAARARPVRGDGLPYTYVMSRNPPPPLYARLPSEKDLAQIEPDLKNHLRNVKLTALDSAFVAPPEADPTPGSLLYGLSAPLLAGVVRSKDALLAGRAKARSGFALLSTFDHDERRYGLTTELAVLPIDRTRVIRTSAFVGLPLPEDTSLPVAFIRSKQARHYIKNAQGNIVPEDKLGYRVGIALSGKTVRTGGMTLLETKHGTYVREDQVVKIDPAERMPSWAIAGQKWIDVSILKQSLVAYEGTKPVYVTLVSTGADGLGDPKKTHSTIQGVFRIHTKHVTVTMDGDDVGDEFDLRDVPFVQYFTEGYALHAAYWHDDFGIPRSHGCVNLAPRDAAWLFDWTTPEVPKEWHAGLSLRGGTIVYTHP
ncbi:MAG TPA: L,D-transpeptidase family protein [Polyangium sp.]|nr:L,D-transpeptidase family protein [Polyangium sp.]